jgi:CheY-like chemotaxis protein
LGKLKLVIADDQYEARRFLVRFLSCEFNILDAVDDGMELVYSAILLKPDVIVSDICMHLLGGPQAMHELHARGIHIPFVFVSAGERIIEPDLRLIRKEDIAEMLVPAIYGAIADSGQPNASFKSPPGNTSPVIR